MWDSSSGCQRAKSVGDARALRYPLMEVRSPFFFLVTSLVLAAGACAVDPSLTSGGDGGDAASQPPDANVTDSTVKDVVAKDQSSPQDSGSDAPGPCGVTCPSGTTCQGATCLVTQGAPCGSSVMAISPDGALSGTTCANAGSSVTTTCSTPVTAGATFIRFPGSGGAWTATVKATNGGLQVEVLSACGGTGTCYSIASGSSMNVSVPQDAAVVIVSTGTCSDYAITYLPS